MRDFKREWPKIVSLPGIEPGSLRDCGPQRNVLTIGRWRRTRKYFGCTSIGNSWWPKLTRHPHSNSEVEHYNGTNRQIKIQSALKRTPLLQLSPHETTITTRDAKTPSMSCPRPSKYHCLLFSGVLRLRSVWEYFSSSECWSGYGTD